MSSSLMRCSVVRFHKPIWLRYYSGSTPDRAIAYIYCCKSGGQILQGLKNRSEGIVHAATWQIEPVACSPACL